MQTFKKDHVIQTPDSEFIESFILDNSREEIAIVFRNGTVAFRRWDIEQLESLRYVINASYGGSAGRTWNDWLRDAYVTSPNTTKEDIAFVEVSEGTQGDDDIPVAVEKEDAEDLYYLKFSAVTLEAASTILHALINLDCGDRLVSILTKDSGLTYEVTLAAMPLAVAFELMTDLKYEDLLDEYLEGLIRVD